VSTHVPVYCMHFEKERSVTGTGGEERLFGYSGVPVRAVRATCAAPLSSASALRCIFKYYIFIKKNWSIEHVLPLSTKDSGSLFCGPT
jgi:hypothetical protein